MAGRLVRLFLVSLPFLVSSVSAQSLTENPPMGSSSSSSSGGYYPHPSLFLPPEPPPVPSPSAVIPPLPSHSGTGSSGTSNTGLFPIYTHSDPYIPPTTTSSSGWTPPLPPPVEPSPSPITPKPSQPPPPAPVNPTPRVDCRQDQGVIDRVQACLAECPYTRESVRRRCLLVKTECNNGASCETVCSEMSQFAEDACRQRCNENIRNDAIRSCECRATTNEPAAECYQACSNNSNPSDLSNCINACVSAQSELTRQCINAIEEQTTGG